jgi:hypothetical protein
VEASVGSSGDDASTAKVEEDNDERDDMVRPLVEALCRHVLTLSRASLYWTEFISSPPLCICHCRVALLATLFASSQHMLSFLLGSFSARTVMGLYISIGVRNISSYLQPICSGMVTRLRSTSTVCLPHYTGTFIASEIYITMDNTIR